MATDLDVAFTAPIGMDVNGEVWTCVEVPGSAELLGTGKAVRVDLIVDGLPLENIGLMVTGRGRHIFSLNAKLRKQLGKDLGDTVDVTLLRRRTSLFNTDNGDYRRDMVFGNAGTLGAVSGKREEPVLHLTRRHVGHSCLFRGMRLHPTTATCHPFAWGKNRWT